MMSRLIRLRKGDGLEISYLRKTIGGLTALIFLLTALLLLPAAAGLAGVKEEHQRIIIDNGYLAWGIPIAGTNRSNSLVRFPRQGETGVGDAPGMTGQILIPMGYLPATAQESRLLADKSFFLGHDQHLKLEYQTLVDNGNMTSMRFDWQMAAHECRVTYTTYRNDDKIFVHIEYLPRSEEINNWQNVSFEGNGALTLLSIDLAPAKGRDLNFKKSFMAPAGSVETFRGLVNTAIWYNTYNYKSKKTYRRIDWMANASLDYNRVVGIVCAPDEQSKSLLWFVQDEPESNYGIRMQVGVKKPVVPGRSYVCDLILIARADRSAEIVANTYKAFNVNGMLRGEFIEQPGKKPAIKVFKWSNPLISENLKIVGSIALEKIGEGEIAEIRAGESDDYDAAAPINSWWIQDGKLLFNVDHRKDLFIFIGRK